MPHATALHDAAFMGRGAEKTRHIGVMFPFSGSMGAALFQYGAVL
jgi:hypothetical protein